MAEDGTSANCSSMDVRLLINKKTGRVLYAEAGKDFVDLLLAFLLLPTGAIIRLLQEHGTASSKSVGSISNVYDSVRKMNAAYMITDKSILLEPLQESSPFNGLPLLQNSTTPREYYSCPIANNGYGKHQISTVPDQKCTCGQEIKTKVILLNHFSSPSSSANSGSPAGYVKDAATFIITDDLNILPISTITGITLLNRLHVKDLSELKETTVTVGPEKVLELLGASMASKTALNDVFSPKSESISKVE
jgi:hypothetical protein